MEASGAALTEDPAVLLAEQNLAAARAASEPVDPAAPAAPVAPDAPAEPTNAELQAQLAALTAKLASIPEPEATPEPKVSSTVRLGELKASGISTLESIQHLVREGYQTFIPVAEHSTTLQALVTIVDEIAGKL
jgi:hypothetical protein